MRTLFRNPNLHKLILLSTTVKHFEATVIAGVEGDLGKRRFISRMSTAKEFPPEKVRVIVQEVAALLKEKKESISVAETVFFPLGSLPCFSWIVWNGEGK